jgi:hypothetical protein
MILRILAQESPDLGLIFEKIWSFESSGAIYEFGGLYGLL